MLKPTKNGPKNRLFLNSNYMNFLKAKSNLFDIFSFLGAIWLAGMFLIFVNFLCDIYIYFTFFIFCFITIQTHKNERENVFSSHENVTMLK